MPVVRVKLDFQIEVASDSLPTFDICDFIERGVAVIDDKVEAILPGARVSITRSRDQSVPGLARVPKGKR